MIKKAALLIAIIGLFLALSSPANVRAVDGLQVLESRVEVDFPMKVNFGLSATGMPISPISACTILSSV